jgi:hypothetical protein
MRASARAAYARVVRIDCLPVWLDLNSAGARLPCENVRTVNEIQHSSDNTESVEFSRSTTM